MIERLNIETKKFLLVASAYVLLTCEPGYEKVITDELRKTSTVREVNIVYGLCDIIAKIESEKFQNVLSNIRKIDKVRSTLTLVVAEDQDRNQKKKV